MVSVMMSSSSNTGFDSDRNDHIVELKASAQQERVSGEEEKLSSSSKNLMSTDSEGKEVLMVAMHDENAARVSDGDGFGSSGLDFISSDEDRVANDAGGFKKLSSKTAQDGRLHGEKGKAGRFPGVKKKKYHKKADVSNADYESMLSVCDDYAASGKSQRAGHGYDVGDMVWGKVKSHPWWPGHVYNEAFATSSVRKMKREGQVLVAFFGDSSYGWFDPAELIPFEPNFAEKSRQTNSRTFVKAVEDAVDELNRKRSLSFACRCRNPYSFRPTDVKGYLAVDFSGSESGVFSVSQIRRARDSFVPGGMLSFLKNLALKPMNSEHWSIHFIQEKAAFLAFRRAVYEEFDETYAQAFNAQPERTAPATASLEPCRAPLSGRLVFAEAPGKRKSPGKHSKPKDQSEKDKYLFKRRDEPVDPKTVKNSYGKSDTFSQPSETAGYDLQLKGAHPDAARPASQATSPDAADVLDPSLNQPVAADQFCASERVQDNLSEKHHSGVADKNLYGETMKVKTDSALKKAKGRKRLLGDVDSEGFVAVEKTKKREKYLFKKTKLGPTNIPSAGGDSSTLMGKGCEKLPAPQVYPVQEDLQVNHQGNDLATCSMLPGSLEAKPVKDLQVELPRLLDELRDLALDPFSGAEKNSFAIVWQVFMNFRSLVYLKSPSTEPKEARPSILSSLASSTDNGIPETYKVMPSTKPTKPPASLDDPTKGGSRRAPSDRLEEMSVKRKKKFNDVKLLAAERRSALKHPEAVKVDRKETAGEVIARTVERKASQKTSDVQRADGKEIARKPMAPTPARVSGSEPVKKKEPPAMAASWIMLVMKFPAEASLPSCAELKAKFSRFGPMDHKATRIFYTTHTCRVVYYHKSDAEAALSFASSNFGSMNVRCYLREREGETPEADSAKVQTEDPHSGTPQLRNLSVSENRLAGQPLHQHPWQLKSCLKRPSSEDGISTAVGGNGSVRGRVKFILGGEGSSRTNATDEAATSHGLNYNTDKFQMVVPPPSSSSTRPVPFPLAPINFSQTEIQPLNMQNDDPAVGRGPPNIDIRQQMISLLSRCEGILKTLEGALGYVPYHL